MFQQIAREQGWEPQEEGPEDQQAEEKEEEEEEDKRMHDPVTNRMANLSLNDELRPAFSFNKSDPQLPQPTETTSSDLPLPHVDPRQTASTQDLPQRLKEPFIANPYPYAPPPSTSDQRPQADPRQAESSARDLPQHLKEPFLGNSPPSHVPPPSEPESDQRPQVSPQLLSSEVPHAWGIPPSAFQGNSALTETRGNYITHDYSVNTTNIGSFNTHSTVVQDSYNDKSTNVNTAEERDLRRNEVFSLAENELMF
ncbi:hypothetical protein CPB84DRAFT_348095 [Gymnopilus junonius]|uniref:Uncharacterized protein n=1 Tax=Gymnopilus junonius TaxID=109634 RepID=A0A9P5NUJ7_GYMJU|nr:hypothetical protein CPB84DRAFT_348095 [Gymnopilus junonius]